MKIDPQLRMNKKVSSETSIKGKNGQDTGVSTATFTSKNENLILTIFTITDSYFTHYSWYCTKLT